MIKVSDYIVKKLEEYGIKDVFMISGGGAMHLNDSVGKSKKIRYICNHHEQASAIGAEGYFRVSGKIGCVIITSGPGGTNTMTGVIGQWLDSIPVIYISGQVKRETTIESYPDQKLRQLGDQEINIVDIVKPVTKYAVYVEDPYKIRYYLEKALYLAMSGRPGPVWLDVPLDVQSSMVDENNLTGYDKKEDEIKFANDEINSKIAKTIELLKNAKRPVIVAGHGIRLSGSLKIFKKVIEKLRIPVLSTFNGFDQIPSDHPLFIGRIGTVGTRAGNFALQNSDLVLYIGTRNNIRQVSYNWETVAREAKKIVIDIDPTELNKPTLKPDIAINCDAKYFLEALYTTIAWKNISIPKEWLIWCTERKKKYPTVLPEYKKLKKSINPYYFIDVLTNQLRSNAIVVAGNGTACVSVFQAGIVKPNQRMFWNSGCASMGYDLPAAIGACIAANKKEVICIAGDGSLQMNMQELQTVAGLKLPIKIFVLNNQGYCSIKQTQDSFFEGRRVACCPETGVTFPDITKIAKAYGISAVTIKNQKSLKNDIAAILNKRGPAVIEVILDPTYRFEPKLSSVKLKNGKMRSKPLEDMFPFLPREEFKSNMLIKELEDNDE
ncbi:thiamine pyrophosphate-binding protein [Candidatus Saganbacteria bacterium]|nr:thiamine pyrophosphate-binding protein [Candidatus Saganbacteria bacterium]